MSCFPKEKKSFVSLFRGDKGEKKQIGIPQPAKEDPWFDEVRRVREAHGVNNDPYQVLTVPLPSFVTTATRSTTTTIQQATSYYRGNVEAEHARLTALANASNVGSYNRTDDEAATGTRITSLNWNDANPTARPGPSQEVRKPRMREKNHYANLEQREKNWNQLRGSPDGHDESVERSSSIQQTPEMMRARSVSLTPSTERLSSIQMTPPMMIAQPVRLPKKPHTRPRIIDLGVASEPTFGEVVDPSFASHNVQTSTPPCVKGMAGNDQKNGGNDTLIAEQDLEIDFCIDNKLNSPPRQSLDLPFRGPLEQAQHPYQLSPLIFSRPRHPQFGEQRMMRYAANRVRHSHNLPFPGHYTPPTVLPELPKPPMMRRLTPNTSATHEDEALVAATRTALIAATSPPEELECLPAVPRTPATPSQKSKGKMRKLEDTPPPPRRRPLPERRGLQLPKPLSMYMETTALMFTAPPAMMSEHQQRNLRLRRGSITPVANVNSLSYMSAAEIARFSPPRLDLAMQKIRRHMQAIDSNATRLLDEGTEGGRYDGNESRCALPVATVEVLDHARKAIFAAWKILSTMRYDAVLIYSHDHDVLADLAAHLSAMSTRIVAPKSIDLFAKYDVRPESNALSLNTVEIDGYVKVLFRLGARLALVSNALVAEDEEDVVKWEELTPTRRRVTLEVEFENLATTVGMNVEARKHRAKGKKW